MKEYKKKIKLNIYFFYKYFFIINIANKIINKFERKYYYLYYNFL
jgi:hypothetical protein